MRIGSRWPVGHAAPPSLTAGILQAVAEEERELAALGADTTGWGWTLTFLEGRAVVELDDGTRIEESGAGVVVLRPEGD